MNIGERFNPYGLFVGAFVPNWLMERQEISQGAKLCYARLAEYAGKDGLAFPSQEAMALSMGVTERQVKRYIKELVEAELIAVDQEHRGLVNRYFFAFTHG